MEYMKDNKKNLLSDTEVIFSYTRQEAIDDGVLIDVSKLAKEAGYRYPVALTSALWADINDIPQSKDWQDSTGRLWDVLHMGQDAIRRSKEGGTVLVYSLIMHVGNRKNYTVKLVCGLGDDAEPVVTLMRPEED
jgi:hypothetical protein